jgi:hypothetical protein
MKKLLLLITFLAATTGMIAKPEKGGKKPVPAKAVHPEKR